MSVEATRLSAAASMELCVAAMESVRAAYRAGGLPREDALSKLLRCRQLYDDALATYLEHFDGPTH